MSEYFRSLSDDEMVVDLLRRLGESIERLAISEAEAIADGEEIEANCYRAQLNNFVRQRREMEEWWQQEQHNRKLAKLKRRRRD